VGRCGLDASGSEHGAVLGFSELGIEPSDSIKFGRFLD
jgi:hypothetical protein